MRIFLVSASYPDEEFPSKSIFVYEQAKELANRGNEIVVLHVKKIATKRFLKLYDNRVKVFNDGFALRFMVCRKTVMESRLKTLNRFLFLQSVNKLYKRAEKKVGKPDVIYAHFSCWAGLSAARISKKYGIPLVTLEHYGGLLGNISRTQKEGIEETIDQSKVFMCVSEGLKQSLLQKVSCSKDIKVVPNMIDRNFHFVPQKKNEKFIISSIGNLYKDKGFDLLINAFCKAFKNSDPVELRIGGGGPEKQKLQKLIEDNGREHQIFLLGTLTREQTCLEYINCSCFALASYHETYGMVYREALITGRPIITTDHGGFSGSDWLDDYGYKIPTGNEQALAKALSLIRSNIAIFDCERISSTCLQSCSADKVGNVVEHYLNVAVQENELY